MKVKMTKGKGFVQIYCELTSKWCAGSHTEMACQSRGERENSEILHGIIEDTDSDSDCDSGNYQSRFQNSETFNV